MADQIEAQFATVKHGTEFLRAAGHFVGTQPFNHPTGKVWFVAKVRDLRPTDSFGKEADVISWHASLAQADAALKAVLAAPDFYPKHLGQPSADSIRAARRDQGME